MQVGLRTTALESESWNSEVEVTRAIYYGKREKRQKLAYTMVRMLNLSGLKEQKIITIFSGFLRYN